MKGLIYRQLYLSKKHLIITSLTLLGTMLLMYLVLLSGRFGNIAKSEEEGILSELYYMMLFYFPMIIALPFLQDTVTDSDFKSKWSLYSYTLPVSAEKHALSKTLFLVIKIISVLIIAVLNVLGMSAVAQIKPNISFVIVSLSLPVFTYPLSAIEIPLCLLFKKKNTASLITGGLMIGVLSIFVVVIRKYISAHNIQIPEDLSLDELMNLLFSFCEKLVERYFWIVPVIFITMTAVNYFGNVVALKRRVV